MRQFQSKLGNREKLRKNLCDRIEKKIEQIKITEDAQSPSKLDQLKKRIR